MFPVLLLSLMTACGQTEYGAPFGGQLLDVVDMHLHTGEWENIPPDTQSFLASNFPLPLGLFAEQVGQSTLNVEGVLEQLDGAGAYRGVLLAVYAPRTVGVTTNELVIEQLAQSPDRLMGLASVRVDNWSTDEQTELDALEAALLQPGMVGVKLAHAHMHLRFDDPRSYSIYALAGELGKPVYLHTGTSPFEGTSAEAPYTDPAYLEEAIAAYPDTVFILGHLGYDSIDKKHMFLETCIDLAVRYDNVYLEPSAMGSPTSDPTGDNLTRAYADIAAADRVDRIIYGSDGPQRPGFLAEYLERSLSAMERADYDREQTAAVLAGNFDRVFLGEGQ